MSSETPAATAGPATPGPTPDAGAQRQTGEPAKKKPRIAAGEGEGEPAPVRGLFEKELPGMMFGFGDSASPLHDTVELVEDIVFEYVSSLLHKAMGTAAMRGKLKYEDFVWQVRDEPAKLERLKDLLEKNEEIKKARKMDYDRSDLLALGGKKKEMDGEKQEGSQQA